MRCESPFNSNVHVSGNKRGDCGLILCLYANAPQRFAFVLPAVAWPMNDNRGFLPGCGWWEERPGLLWQLLYSQTPPVPFKADLGSWC